MSHSSPGHGGHYDTKYSLFDQILRAVFVGERIWVFYLNQPVTAVENLILTFFRELSYGSLSYESVVYLHLS